MGSGNLLPDQWFTLGTLSTVGGAGLLANIITSTLHQLFELNPRRTSFVASLLLVFSSYFSQRPSVNIPEWIVAFGNACLVYATAVGLNVGANEAAKEVKRRRATPREGQIRALELQPPLARFWQRWF